MIFLPLSQRERVVAADGERACQMLGRFDLAIEIDSGPLRWYCGWGKS